MKVAACIFSFSLSLFSSLSPSAQSRYPVGAIAPALLKNAHVVKRMEEISVELKSLTEVVQKKKFALTVLDEAGRDEAELVVEYDQLKKIESIEGALYDAAGKQLKKVKGKDINDYSASDGVSMYSDSRVKEHSFGYSDYPYTVEYEVEVTYRHSYVLPGWMPQTAEHTAVEQSRYTVVTPADYTLRYKMLNYGKEPVVSTEKGKTTRTWEIKNLVPVSRPFASPSWPELLPAVYVAPSDFQLGAYKGNANTWQEFGKFQQLLNADRDRLPASVEQKVKELTGGVADPREKVAKLYAFLQQTTRYVGIQLGIGGWQPFDAAYVAQKGYGDCKALSNYMYSLLKAAGIKSCYTLIHAGRSPEDRFFLDDFPDNYFNHIVLCVPLQKDTLWLECTSQTKAAGYMGGFTGNRTALAITEDGGKLVSTPRYGTAENLQVRKLTAAVDGDGNLTVSSRTVYKAVQQDDLNYYLNNLTKEKVKKMLNEAFELSTYDVGNFSYATVKNSLPEVDETLQISVANYATVSGRRLFLTPNIMNRNTTRHTPSDDRTCDYVFDNPYTAIDSVEITLPASYKAETQMPEVAIKTAYGNYTASVKLRGDNVFYYRKMERFSGRFPAKEGTQIAKFFDDVYKADRNRIVLVRKDETAKPAM